MQQAIRRSLSRRSLFAGSAGLAGVAALARSPAFAQQKAQLGAPASVISNPPRDWSPGHPAIYPDPDVIVVDPSFIPLRRAQGAIYRVWTGALWAEGPTWSNQGQYLVFSDVSGNTLYRYIWDDGRVTAFRRPSNNANGNAFDFQGRLLSCEDFFRRLVRWEHDGTVTVIAASYDSKPLNSPNGVAPHPDGSIWFTDPGYGDQIAEGHPDEAGGPTNPQGILNPRIGAENAGAIGGKKRELPTNTYRWDPSGKLEIVVSQEEVPDPNGLCFSPDHKTFYLISTGKGPGDTGPGGRCHLCFRSRRRKTQQQALVHEHDGGRDQMRARRHVRRRLWQFVVRLQRATGIRRGAGVQPGRQADRPHPPARSMRESHLRRAQARPSVYGGEPVALYA